MMRKGNTILEMLIAMFVIMVGLIAVVGLSFRTVIYGRESIKQLQAANFTREGIEIVRNIRDSNKYKPGYGSSDKIWEGIKENGNRGQDNAVDNSKFNDASAPDFQLVNFVGNETIVERSDHFFVQGAVPAGSKPTQFRRKVNLYAICENGYFERTERAAGDAIAGRSSSGGTCALSGGTATLVGIEAVSTVFWNEGGNPRSLTAEERFYNW